MFGNNRTEEAKMRNIQREGESIDRRWENCYKDGDVRGCYEAKQDFSENVKKQEEQLKNMEPGSRAYDDAKQKLQDAKQKETHMTTQNKYNNHHAVQDGYEKAKAQTEKYGRDMQTAIKNKDSEAYDKAMAGYKKSVQVEKSMENDMKSRGLDHFDGNGSHMHEAQLQDYDRSMGESLANSKKPADQQKAQHYHQQAEKDVQNQLKSYAEERVEKQKQAWRDSGIPEDKIEQKAEEMRQEELHRAARDMGKSYEEFTKDDQQQDKQQDQQQQR